MLLRLKKSTPEPELQSLLALAREMGYEPRLLDQHARILELLGGPGRPEDRSRFEDRPAVESVIDAADAPERVVSQAGQTETVVSAAEARFGAGNVSIIAGPCAVEDEETLFTIARAVHAAGATLLRGGAFKPRTSPYAFQGLGQEGLDLLGRVKDEVGIGVVTEVLDTRDVERVSRVADMLQIGSRNMANFALLREAGKSGKPILLKRGMSATAREFLLAAEYVLAEGNDQVVLCERGIRGFDSATRNVLDLGTVAHLKRATHLPVISDPSHGTGRSELVGPMGRASLAAGADGIIVEVHPQPAEARSDGRQAISPEQLCELVNQAEALVGLDRRKLVRPNPKKDSATREPETIR